MMMIMMNPFCYTDSCRVDLLCKTWCLLVAEGFWLDLDSLPKAVDIFLNSGSLPNEYRCDGPVVERQPYNW